MLVTCSECGAKISSDADPARNPRPQGCQKLSGQSRFRIRQGDYRIVYSIEDKNLTVDIAKIGHRRGIYRL